MEDEIFCLKKFTLLEILCLVNFFKFHNFSFSTIQALESAKPPEKYAFADSTVPMVLTSYLMKLEKNLQGFCIF